MQKKLALLLLTATDNWGHKMTEVASHINHFEKTVANLFTTSNIDCLLNEDILNSGSWMQFKDSWNDLHIDEYMNDDGKYRQRRFCKAKYNAVDNSLWLKEHDYYFQPTSVNPLNGGLKRWFSYLTGETFYNAVFNKLLKTMGKELTIITGQEVWDINVYQNRIIAEQGNEGKPSPEGIHKDGVKYSLLLLMNRKNVSGGENTIYDLKKTPLFSHTLKEEGECILFADDPTFHYASEIIQLNKSTPGYRDILVVEFY